MDQENDTQETLDTTDDFDAAFAAASGEPVVPADDPTPPAQPPAAEAAEGVEGAEGAEGSDTPQEPAKPDATPPAQSPAAEGAEGAEGSDKPQEPAKPDATPPAQPPAADQIDPKFLAQAIAEAQIEAEKKRNQQAPAEEPAKPKVVNVDDLLNDADKASIAKFKTEWPDEYVAIERMMQANTQAAVSNALSAYTQQLNQFLAPLMTSVQSVEVNNHRATVLAAHPDLDQIAPEVYAWVETQPSVVRPAFKRVLEQGSAAEVVEVLNLYKAAKVPTGAAPVTPASSAAQEPQPKPTKVVDQKAVAALAAVPAAQRPRQQGADRNDFDGAFEEASAQLANS